MMRKFELIIKSDYKDYSERELREYIERAFDEMIYPYDAEKITLTERTIAKNATVHQLDLIEE